MCQVILASHWSILIILFSHWSLYRMSLAYGGIPYNYTNTQAYFGCDFMTAKTSGKLPGGQLPVLAVDGELISQSGKEF